MSSSLDNLELCRLCLVKDEVSVPIFGDENDIRQIFLKITACLPVKVSREDKLPKKICEGCAYKVDMLYQFWNTTVDAEKQLLQWLDDVGSLEDKQSYVTEVLETNVMKQERISDSRLDGSIMQVSEHQNNMDMGMMDNMSLISMSGSEQQFTSVPMDTSGTVQTVQAVAGPSTQTHNQMTQSQTHLVEEEEESEEEDNSDDGCDNEEGLPVKEETEDQNDRPLEPTTFVSLPCDEAGPSGLQQQKISEMSEIQMQQTTDGDPKTGVRVTRGRQLVFQKKLVKIPSWKNLEMSSRKIAKTARSAPMVQVKIEPAEVFAATDDFEEVSIDGSEAVKSQSSEPVVAKPPKKRSEDIIMYMCNACKVYFPMKSMLEQHHKSLHANVGSGKVTAKNQTENKQEEKVFYAGYHKDKSGQYVCNYCPFQSLVRTTISSHAVRKHGTVLEVQPDSTVKRVGQTQEVQIAMADVPVEDIAAVPKIEMSDDDDDDEALWPIESVEEFPEEEEDIKLEEEELKNPLDISDNKVRNCPYCPFVTCKSSTFHSHIKRKHRDDWLRSIAEKVAALQPQKNAYVSEKQCRYCKFRTGNRSTMHSHVIRKHPQHRSDLDIFTIEIKDENSIDVEEAEAIISTSALEKDIIEEEGGKPRQARKCPYCHFESWVTSTMQSHVSRHHRGRKSGSTPKRQPSTQLYTGYACHFCTFVAATVASFHAHTNREHSGQKQPIKEVPVTEYDCDQCDFKSRNRRNMQLHVKQCHTTQANADGMYACHACSYETLSRMGLQRHVSIKHNKPRREALSKSIRTFYICEECDFKCLNRKMMDWHKRQHNAPPNAEDNGNTYFCNDCDFSTWTKGQLYLHIRRKHKDADGNDREVDADQMETIFTCDQCDYTSKNKHVMKVHVIRKHTNEYNHECEICGKKYKVKADLTNHIRFQHREQPIICDVCGKTCRNSNLLYLHQKFAHYKPEFECPICHRRMVSQANLDDHILKQHEQREDVVCEECGKRFTRQARLKIHMRIHTGIKPYTCKICRKAFARRNGLRQHLLIHSGQRPYICDICGKSFTQKTGLISHRKSHPGLHPPLPRVTIDHVLSDLLNEES